MSFIIPLSFPVPVLPKPSVSFIYIAKGPSDRESNQIISVNVVTSHVHIDQLLPSTEHSGSTSSVPVKDNVSSHFTTSHSKGLVIVIVGAVLSIVASVFKYISLSFPSLLM